MIIYHQESLHFDNENDIHVRFEYYEDSGHMHNLNLLINLD